MKVPEDATDRAVEGDAGGIKLKKILGIVLGLFFGVILSAATVCSVRAKDSDGDIVIVVDPGHGSIDGGANQNGVEEEDVNWGIATALKAELETYWGVKVYLTRGSSEYNSNTGRGRFGLSVNADLIVSIHNNSGDASVKGIEVYGTVNPSYSQMVSSIGNSICQKVSALGLVNRGYKTRTSSSDSSKDYYTLIDEAVRAGIPAMIVEHCFLTNTSDAAFISNPDNQKKVGAADATAIASYFGLSKRGVANGSSITLTRTYSANFVTSLSGTFSSSNTAVAVVDSNGIITAVGAGSADITCTSSNGQTEKVKINVPEVKMIGLAAGITPTFYNSNDQIDNANIIVKAIYSDGSAKQVSGYTVGEAPASSNGICDIPISYNGFSCTLRVYKTGSQGSFTGGSAYKPGTNSDILVCPQLYQSVNTGINISLSSVSSNYVGVTGTAQNFEPVTQTTETQPETQSSTQETTTETVTEEVTTEATTEVTTEEITTETNSDETTASYITEEPTTSAAAVSINNNNNNTWKIMLIIIIGIVAIAAGAAAVIIFFNIKNKKINNK